MITSIIIAIIFALGAIICYVCVATGAQADYERKLREEKENELYGQDYNQY